MAESFVHRVWKSGTVALMLIVTLHLALKGFFKPKTPIIDFTPMAEKYEARGQKMIFMLFDALREDFVSWPGD